MPTARMLMGSSFCMNAIVDDFIEVLYELAYQEAYLCSGELIKLKLLGSDLMFVF